jgi:hypothetical protein
MSDRNEAQPSFELPAQPVPLESLEPGQEQIAATPESTGNQAGTAAPPQQQPSPQMPVQLQATQTPTGPTNIVVKDDSLTGGLPAQDADLIEKEWVDKAKAIVSQTQDDPFHQKSEISKVKAEYIQKRFKKTLPVQETGE